MAWSSKQRRAPHVSHLLGSHDGGGGQIKSGSPSQQNLRKFHHKKVKENEV